MWFFQPTPYQMDTLIPFQLFFFYKQYYHEQASTKNLIDLLEAYLQGNFKQ